MQAFEEAGEREATELEAAMDRQTQDLDNHFSDL